MKKVGLILIVILLVIGLIIIKPYFYRESNGDELSLEVILHHNGAYVSKSSVSCKLFNDSCRVTLPEATRTNGTVLGYSKNKNSMEAEYHVNEEITLTSNIELYVVSYTEYKLHVNNQDLDYLSNNDITCKAYNTNKNCDVTLPQFNKKGYELKGYSLTNDSLTGYFFPKEEVTIDKDTYIYPIYNTLMHNEVIKVKEVLYEPFIIEIENDCDLGKAEELINYLKKVIKEAPFLDNNPKITLMGDETFDRIWTNQFAGKTYGVKSNKALDIRCSKAYNHDFYATIVHELGHVWDFSYSLDNSNTITEQNDVINMYNKYRFSDNRPLRDYSYTDIKEFFADMVRYYYFKYLIKDEKYYDIIYPSDMKSLIEKYIELS